MESIKVGDKRKWKGGSVVFEVKAIYKTEATIEQVGGAYPYAVKTILTHSEPYQEPKPVRRLVAFEHERGAVVFRYSDKNNDSERHSDYRKLSDEELKELIKGVIGE